MSSTDGTLHARSAGVFRACAAVSLLIAASSVLAGIASPSEPPLEDILVTGERPGPGMWRVSSGEHALWILATLEPLPKDMVWHSQVVESRIAASQVVLAPPRVDADIGFFRGLTLLPSLYASRKNPGGATLEQTLPHDLYMRWLALRVKYLGSFGDDEKLRPLVAAFDLYSKALARSGLSDDESVWKEVEHAAHRDHVPVAAVTLKLKIPDPHGAIRELSLISRASEIGCLDTTMRRLESDLPDMRVRANLWSLGDIKALRALPYPDETVACLNALFSVPSLRTQFMDAAGRLDAVWLDAAELALRTHASSFAVVPMTLWLKPDGLLERLRALGYGIEDPQ